MRLFHSNVHCKHIVLACSADNSYAGFLRQYIPTDPRDSKVTLIESVPFASQIRDVAARFDVTKCRSVFRDTKIEKPEPAPLPIRRVPSFEDNRPASTGSYASSLRTNAPSEPMSIAPPSVPRNASNASRAPVTKEIFINQYGERVDNPLQIRADFNIVSDLKTKKLCNKYFLGVSFSPTFLSVSSDTFSRSPARTPHSL
jgi:hypothetical protein